jgi:hypothetical protein
VKPVNPVPRIARRFWDRLSVMGGTGQRFDRARDALMEIAGTMAIIGTAGA